MFYPSDYTATAFYLGYRPLFPFPRRVPVKAFRKRHTERIPEKRAHRDNPADGMEPADAHSMQTRHPEIQRRSRRAHSYYETGNSDIRRPTDFPLQPVYRHRGRETPDKETPGLPRRLNTHAPLRPKQRLASRHDSAAQRQPVLDGPPRLPRLHTTEMTNGPIGFIVRERSAVVSAFS